MRNLVPAGKDANGHLIFKADRTKVTIQDVIAAEGPRLPDVSHSQRKFNTGIVIVVQRGEKPSPELIERAEAIRKQWIDYFSITGSPRFHGCEPTMKYNVGYLSRPAASWLNSSWKTLPHPNAAIISLVGRSPEAVLPRQPVLFDMET